MRILVVLEHDERGLRLADDFRKLGGRERELVRRVVRRVRVRGRADLS